MGVEYLACGNIMSDRIQSEDGSYSEWNMGGPAFYALSGMRTWTPQVKLVCKTGADYADSYGRWMDDNGVTRESVRVELEEHTRYTLRYNRDGSFTPTPHFSMEHLGYLKTHADDIDEAAAGCRIKGMYMAHNCDAVVWENLRRIKEKHGLKIMWEIEYAGIYRQQCGISREHMLEKIRNVMQTADAWSLNHNEAADLFDLPREDDDAIIRRLQELPIAFTFYRVGARGAYAVTKTAAYFAPSVLPAGPAVDPTGCGNCSTGAAAYAYFQGEEPAMVAAMAMWRQVLTRRSGDRIRFIHRRRWSLPVRRPTGSIRRCRGEDLDNIFFDTGFHRAHIAGGSHVGQLDAGNQTQKRISHSGADVSAVSVFFYPGVDHYAASGAGASAGGAGHDHRAKQGRYVGDHAGRRHDVGGNDPEP